MDIEIMPEELKRIAAVFKASSEKCTVVQRRLMECTQSLLQTCRSQSISAFELQYQVLYNNLFVYKEILEIIARDLDTTANVFQSSQNTVELLLQSPHPEKPEADP